MKNINMSVADEITVEIKDLRAMVDLWGHTEDIKAAFIQKVYKDDPELVRSFLTLQKDCQAMLRLCGESEKLDEDVEAKIKKLKRIKIKGIDLHKMHKDLDTMRKNLYRIVQIKWKDASWLYKGKNDIFDPVQFRQKSKMWKGVEQLWEDMRRPKRRIEKQLDSLEGVGKDIRQLAA